MTTFWRIGDNYINPAHIIRVEFTPAEASIEEWYNDETGQYEPKPAKRAKAVIVMTELVAQEISYDFSVFHLAAASASKIISVTGPEAERLVYWLSLAADFPADEPMADEVRA